MKEFKNFIKIKEVYKYSTLLFLSSGPISLQPSWDSTSYTEYSLAELQNKILLFYLTVFKEPLALLMEIGFFPSC